MVTKSKGRKDDIRIPHRGDVADGELHLPHSHPLNHDGSGFAHHQPPPYYVHHPVPVVAGPPMHPLAPASPPAKKAKRNHRSTADESTTAHYHSRSPVMMQLPKPSPVKAPTRRSSITPKVAPPTPQVLPTPVSSRVTSGKKKSSALPQNPYSTSRGLRHFSLKVCEKVEEKGTTTYNEVADELVRELKQAELAIKAAAAARGETPPTTTKSKKKEKENDKTGKAKKNHDDKNIRRRVYDALNVLMAMDIITKEKKEITWRGLPGSHLNLGQDDLGDDSGLLHLQGDGSVSSAGSHSQSSKKRKIDALSRRQRIQTLQDERTKRHENIRRKRECLQQLMAQNVSFQNLLRRNHAREMEGRHMKISKPVIKGEQDNGKVEEEVEKVPLPFLIVNTDSRAVVQCEMCPERTNVSFDFSLPFEINDDNEILKRLGLNHTSKEVLQHSLPPDLFHYCNAKGLLESIARPYMPPFGHR